MFFKRKKKEPLPEPFKLLDIPCIKEEIDVKEIDSIEQITKSFPYGESVSKIKPAKYVYGFAELSSTSWFEEQKKFQESLKKVEDIFFLSVSRTYCSFKCTRYKSSYSGIKDEKEVFYFGTELGVVSNYIIKEEEFDRTVKYGDFFHIYCFGEDLPSAKLTLKNELATFYSDKIKKYEDRLNKIGLV
jgi:hypothetical protein